MPDYTKVYRTIRNDRDFRALSKDAQLLYFWLLVSPSLNYAGIIDWRPARLTNLWPGATVAVIRDAGEELRRTLFVFPDDETEEALIRSFARYDKAVKQKNLGVTLARNYIGIASDTLRLVLRWELGKFREAEPSHSGWESLAAILDGPLIDPTMDPEIDPQIYPQRRETEGQSSDAEGLATHNSQLTTHNYPRRGREAGSPDQPRPELEALCERLASAVEKNDFKRPEINQTAIRSARLLIDTDGYTVEQIEWMIDWAAKHPFWYKNVRSMAKLREQFDRLKADVKDDAARAANGGRTPRLPAAPSLTPVEELQEPPEGLTDAELSAWFAADRKRRGV